ncbi:hypothetical protein PG996_006899 [Apiospora saccharicola]|uniref:Uncharacterized protein n=1 Tax=Apiospora saccharicola TaxID=335842 RepID=A0ABR1V9B0_9PEZI
MTKNATTKKLIFPLLSSSMHFVIKELLQYVKCKAVFFEFDGLGSGPYGHHLQVQPSKDGSMQQVLLR